MNRGNPLGLGLVIAGAAAMIIATFLPMNESTGVFSRIQENTLIQHDGWILVIVAISIAAGGFRAFYGSEWAWPLAGSAVAAVGIVIWATNTDIRTLYPVSPGGVPDTSGPGTVASLGIAIYVAGLGVTLAVAGSLMLREGSPGGPNPSSAKKKCPDCAETILSDALVCKHCGYRFPAAVALPDPPDVEPATRTVRCHACQSVQTVPAGTTMTACNKCEATMKIPRGSRSPASAPATRKIRCFKCKTVQDVAAKGTTFTCENCEATIKIVAADA